MVDHDHGRGPDKDQGGAMTRTLGDITNELKNKVLDPAKEEAERMVSEARSQADAIVRDAKREATRIKDDARQQAQISLKQMEIDMDTAARNFILLAQERLEKAIVRPVVEEEIKSVLDNKDFLSSIIEILITEFSRTHGKENKIEILLPSRHKEVLEEWFVNKFLQKATSGVVIHFSDKVAFGFKLGFGETGTFFNFGEGFVEVFSEFCSPRFRKHFFTSNKGF